MTELIYAWNKNAASHFISIKGRQNNVINPLVYTSPFMQMPYPVKVKDTMVQGKEKRDVYGGLSCNTSHITDKGIQQEVVNFIEMFKGLDEILTGFVQQNATSFAANLGLPVDTVVDYKTIIYASEMTTYPSINFKCINTQVFNWTPMNNSAAAIDIEQLHLYGVKFELDVSAKLAIPSLFYWYDENSGHILVKAQVYANEIYAYVKQPKVIYNPQNFQKYAMMYQQQAKAANAPTNNNNGPKITQDLTFGAPGGSNDNVNVNVGKRGDGKKKVVPHGDMNDDD